MFKTIITTCLAGILALAAFPASASSVYWSLFNLEGENLFDSIYVTYGTLDDMLNDTNRTGSFEPDTFGDSAQNVVGSGSDGSTYWSLFNLEGESQFNSIYVTYGTLDDMLNDTNRTGSFEPDTFGGSARNVVGSGSDGSAYWSLFNLEGESLFNSIYVTYGTLDDMLNDTNRTGSFEPDSFGGSARNVVGSGAYRSASVVSSVPLPGAGAMLAGAFMALAIAARRKRFDRVRRMRARLSFPEMEMC